MAILTTTALFLMTVSSVQALTCYSCEKKKLESGEILVETGGNCLEVTQVCTGPGEVCVQGNYEIMYRGKKQIYVYSKLCDIPCDDADQCNETFCSTDLCNDMTVQQTTDYVYGQKEREEEERRRQEEEEERRMQEEEEEEKRRKEEEEEERRKQEEEEEEKRRKEEEEEEERKRQEEEESNGDDNTIIGDVSEDGNGEERETSPDGGEEGEGEDGTYIVDNNDQNSDQNEDESVDEKGGENGGFSVFSNNMMVLSALVGLVFRW